MPPASPTVLVVGDVLLDVVVYPEGRSRARLGGTAATTATAVAAHGVDVLVAGRIGDDATGAAIRHALQAAGLPEDVSVVPGELTGRCVVFVSTGQPIVQVELGAAASLRARDVPRATLAGVRHLHLSGYLLAHGRARTAGRRLLRDMRNAGRVTSLQTPRLPALAGVRPRRWRDMFDDVDLLVTSGTEAAWLTGTDRPEQALNDLSAGRRDVVLTQGKRPALWCTPAGRITVADVPALISPEAFPPGPVGAGDAFAGGIIVPWLTGRGPAACLSAGHEAAAQRLRTVGSLAL